MCLAKIFRDITTGTDNQTHEISRVIMVSNALLLVPVLVAGVMAYLYGWYAGKPFDVQTLFTAVLTYETGVGALLASGSWAIVIKRAKPGEALPDGSASGSSRT